MKKYYITTMLILLTLVLYGQSPVDFLTEEVTVKSSILEEDRKITIFKPQNSTEPLSIIYLLDGEWNFELTSGILDLFIRWSRIPSNTAIIAVHNQGTRTLDLTPTKDDKRFPGSGGGEKFLSFVTDELIPYVDKNVGESSDRLLLGHSFGGLFGLYALFERPELFSGCIAISPSTWYGDNFLFNASYAEKLKGLEAKKFFFITTGEYDMGNTESNKQYVDWLRENESKTGLDIYYKQYAGRNHFSNVVPSTDEGLSRYFPGPELKEEIINNYEEGGLSQLKQWYNKIESELGNRFVSPSGSMLEYAGSLRGAGKSEEALELLLWYKMLEPENGNVYYYIGAISQEVSKMEQAKEHYEIALTKKLPERVKIVITRNLETINN